MKAFSYEGLGKQGSLKIKALVAERNTFSSGIYWVDRPYRLC